MTDPHRSLDDDPLPEEIETADALLDQADALLQRHRGAGRIITALGDDLNSEDLPLLTEVVEDLPPPRAVCTPHPDGAIEATRTPPESAHRVSLDDLEAWLAEALPPILAEEIESLTHRLQSRLLAALSTRFAQEDDPTGHDQPTS
ncbi:MAG: hypothetical protein JNM61_11415 [Zoogloeaceae bacterium]|nr:hypothetical protein [Zoogloeaceae bacterium]